MAAGAGPANVAGSGTGVGFCPLGFLASWYLGVVDGLKKVLARLGF
jgi:hypothetical protein